MKFKETFGLFFFVLYVSHALGNPLHQPASKLASFVEEYEKEAKKRGGNREFQPEHSKSNWILVI